MKCPTCGETKTSTIVEAWGNREPEFWAKVKKVQFLCGGKYIYNEITDEYEVINKCRRK